MDFCSKFCHNSAAVIFIYVCIIMIKRRIWFFSVGSLVESGKKDEENESIEYRPSRQQFWVVARIAAKEVLRVVQNN